MSVMQTTKNVLRDNIYPTVFNFMSGIMDFSNSLRAERINRLKEVLKARPLLLAIETVSACNARCVFCPYPNMKRKREVMEPQIFRKIVSEYAQMGGGALSLTPVMGDLFLDTHLLDRFEVLDKYPNINQITFTTNGIAFEKFSDEDLKFIFQRTYLVQFSIGGLDKQTYQKLYQVDKFEAVFEAIERTIVIRDSFKHDLKIILAFRTNNHNFLIDFADQLNQFKNRGVLISHISVYNNFGGKIAAAGIKIKKNRVFHREKVCVLPFINPHVYSNGKITNCGCVDVDGNGLVIGDASRNSLDEAWRGIRRGKILGSFSQGKPPKLCQNCTAYKSLSYLGSDVFKNIKSNAPLPVEFYVNFLGG